MDNNITLPSKPRVVEEDGHIGLYEIDSLYPGYGHTLGNSLRRVILSSLPGAAITSIKIDDVEHEFSTLEGVKQDVIMILLNLRKVRFQLTTDEPQTVKINVQGPKQVTAGDIEVPGQVTIVNKDQVIADVTAKKPFVAEMTVERGVGYIPREVIQEERVDIGSIALDATFTPIRRVHYEVENMRVGDRTDFNRLRIYIETDATLTAREALEQSIEIMIHQLKSVIGFKDDIAPLEDEDDLDDAVVVDEISKEEEAEAMKTRVDSLNLSARTINVLTEANIRTVGGLARKRQDDILSIPGMGIKGLQEVKRALSNFGITLK